VEVDEDALRALLAALPAAPPLDPLTRSLWESVAWLLAEKRMPEQALAFVEPVAQRFGPWARLDRTMARAYGEVLEPETALRYLERARAAEPASVALLVESAFCAHELGRAAEARGYLEEALALPRSAEVDRGLGLALVRLGDERGRALLQRWLTEHPEDEEVRAALGLPPVQGSPP
jgi:tetratricopeptide (TPR) repeat protein